MDTNLENDLDLKYTMREATDLARLGIKDAPKELLQKNLMPVLSGIAFTALSNKRRVSGKSLNELVKVGVQTEDPVGFLKSFAKYYKGAAEVDRTPLNKTEHHVGSYNVDKESKKVKALEKETKKVEKETKISNRTPEEVAQAEKSKEVNNIAKEAISRVKGKVTPQDMGALSKYLHKNNLTVDEAESLFRAGKHLDIEVKKVKKSSPNLEI